MPRIQYGIVLNSLMLLAGGIAAADDKAAPQHPANRLAKETSPYLLQHARNPVDWYPWGPEAFAKAKAEGKPIFLSVGYSSCYWCHVMERECFEDEAIAKILNRDFVAIKVDREERPDVDAVYMAALRAFSGGGGWPMSMFLFPDGRPFFGGTYFPAKEKNGLPGFEKLLGAVHDAWADHRAEIDRDATSLTDAARRLLTADARRKAPLSRSLGFEGVAQLAEQFDPEFAGFGYRADQPKRPKFPEPVNLVFLLNRVRRGAESPRQTDPMGMVAATLDRMARGGIRDHLAGGFHRYSVDRRWAVPHFEKMLYDNAQLASAYLMAYEQDKDPRWEREARDIFAYVARSMTDPAGGFYSALDAEAEAEEGRTYVWSRAEIRAALGDRDAETFAAAYGLDLDPNFEEGRYVLLMPRPLAETARALGTAPDALEARLAPMRAKLLALRDQRPQPFRDDKVLSGWNGLMIAAYADGYRVLKDDSYRLAAEKAAEFLLGTMRDQDGRLLRTCRAGQARGGAYLEDYAFLAHGLLRLHAATGEAKRLEQAKALADRLLADFADEEAGGFYSTADDHETLFARPKDPYDNALPGGNSMAILDLVEIGRLTGEAKYLDAAGKALDAFSSVLQRSPAAAPLMLVALDAYLDARPPKDENPLKALRPKIEADEPADAVVVGDVRVPEAATIGSEVALTVRLKIRDGWHLYANPSGAETATATRVELRGEGLGLATVAYPAGEAKVLSANDGQKIRVYEGRVEIPLKAKVDPQAGAGRADATIRVHYQACDDRRCLRPMTLDLPVSLILKPPGS